MSPKTNCRRVQCLGCEWAGGGWEILQLGIHKRTIHLPMERKSSWYFYGPLILVYAYKLIVTNTETAHLIVLLHYNHDVSSYLPDLEASSAAVPSCTQREIRLSLETNSLFSWKWLNIRHKNKSFLIIIKIVIIVVMVWVYMVLFKAPKSLAREPSFIARQFHRVTYPTCTGSSSTLTWPAISSMSTARWQMDLAWCVHGSGRPLTVMYLSPTVSTCVNKGVEINQSTNK